MNSLLIEVYVPSIGGTFDVSIPSSARVFELLPLIIVAVSRIAEGLFVSKNMALCDGSTGTIFRNNMTVEDMQLKNGSRILLI